MKKKTFLTGLVIGAIVLGYAVISDPIWADQVVRYPDVLLGDYIDTGTYTFNPETILEALKRGETDVFKLPSGTPEARPSAVALTWKQSDYLKIANALHQYVWKETLVDWRVYSMIFDGDCRYDPVGFDVVRMIYFKAIGMRQYTAHKIDLYPLSGRINWGGGTNYPRSLFNPWRAMDLKRYKVAADDALRLAEENGGRDARLAAKNACRIHLILGDSGWTVDYQGRSLQVLFEMTVSPYTGKHEILPSK